MCARRKPVEVTEEQVLWFRARRSHLAGPGAPDAATAARDILGAQSQQLSASLLALSLRTKGRPTAEALATALFAPDRTLVRTWGQRDTLHVYDPVTDWADVVAARDDWHGGGRRGAMPPKTAITKARRLIAKHGGLVRRGDVFPAVPKTLLAEAEEKVGPGEPARRLASGRLIWKLAHAGELCLAEKVGSEQSYAARETWFEDLDWPDPGPTAQEANERLTRRYLAVHGPATAHDVAHFFGGNVSAARRWLAPLDEAGELIDVTCGDRDGLLALANDVAALREKPPTRAAGWPVRLLPMWDTLLMGHRDKSWTVPDAAEEKLVWKKAAVVAPVVVARGRFVATWTHKARKRSVDVTVTPLSGWRAKHAAAVRREAAALAEHLGIAAADVVVEG